MLLTTSVPSTTSKQCFGQPAASFLVCSLIFIEYNHPALSYDDENPDDEKNEVEAYDAEINEIAPDDLGEDVDLNEEDDEFSDDDAENIVE